MLLSYSLIITLFALFLTQIRSETKRKVLPRLRESTSPLFLLLDIVGELFEVHEFVGEVLAAVPLKPVALPLLANGEVGTA